MMKKYKILIPILVLSLFLLTACNGAEQPVQKKGAYLGGEQGVSAEFESFGIEEEKFIPSLMKKLFQWK